MKYLLTLLLATNNYVIVGQTNRQPADYPFQVLYAQNVKNQAGHTLESLDLISIEDILHVDSAGELSLFHYYGLPVDFSGDTTIIVKKIQDLLVRPVAGKASKTTKSNISRPYIDYLFIADKKEAREKGRAIGACDDCYRDLEIVYPPRRETREILAWGSLCIRWASSESRRFEVEVKNIFGDLLKTYATHENELNINEKEFRELVGKETVLLFQIKDPDTKNYSTETVVRPIQADRINLPYICPLDRASVALMAGFHIEQLRRNNFKDAEYYFELATKLSANTFYSKMLENFRKRRE